MSALVLERGDQTTHKLASARIKTSANRAQRLIDDLLDFTQARVGRGLSVKRQPIDLHAVVAEALEELATTFAGHQLLHRRIGEGECVADADRLAQAVGNLVGNAVSYGAAGRPISITTQIDAATFSIAVHNEGAAIDGDTLVDLFEPMTRGTGTTLSGRSVGLGLFIVRGIARAHDGSVAVTSTPDAGTTFTITCPR